MSAPTPSSNELSKLRENWASRQGSAKGQYRMSHRDAGILFSEVERLQRAIVDRDRKLAECSIEIFNLESDKKRAAVEPKTDQSVIETLRRIADPDFRYSSDDDEDTQLSLRMDDARAALNRAVAIAALPAEKHQVTPPDGRLALEPETSQPARAACTECQRMREGLQLIATDEHRLMNITARQTAASILAGKPSGVTTVPPAALYTEKDCAAMVAAALAARDARSAEPAKADEFGLPTPRTFPSMPSATEPPSPSSFKVGDRARFSHGNNEHDVEILESLTIYTESLEALTNYTVKFQDGQIGVIPERFLQPHHTAQSGK